jgi:hypothetical protein
MAEVQQIDPCPIVPAPGRGTAGQTTESHGGSFIRSLADRVIERDKAWDTMPRLAVNQGQQPQQPRKCPPSLNWSAEDWCGFYHERAAILECDNNLPRVEAERVAYGTTLAKWMDAHRPPTDRQDQCAHCRSDRPGAVLIPCLSASGGHYGVHDKCLPDLLEGMRQRGIAALSAYGLAPSLGERRRG